MRPDDRVPDFIARLSPEEQTAWFSQQTEDWPSFVAGIAASRAELETYRAAGGQGLPPGWISANEYMRQRGLRSLLQSTRALAR